MPCIPECTFTKAIGSTDLYTPEEQLCLRLAERGVARAVLGVAFIIPRFGAAPEGPVSVWIRNSFVHSLAQVWVLVQTSLAIVFVRSLHYPPPALVLARNDVDDHLVQSGQDVVDEGPILKDRHERLHGSFREQLHKVLSNLSGDQLPPVLAKYEHDTELAIRGAFPGYRAGPLVVFSPVLQVVLPEPLLHDLVRPDAVDGLQGVCGQATPLVHHQVDVRVVSRVTNPESL
eukprot:CAMPEP_0198475190 /NCGR_PEP_ID=MMETSP1456-20131121/40688_1 /TAXON_ID=1461544 ORGANISM="Unidentified sp., Strain RCC1871" /NCGR_SAMPLE_ID=MMETSP1456 /ASSEMBLY_ACC=CAM_ASM_001119 /LENGTH=230 /DNA_ID=CAMNT_0044201887 /DNA_START=364 /DNA_END=1055 /DNA_ORIENTATION=-